MRCSLCTVVGIVAVLFCSACEQAFVYQNEAGVMIGDQIMYPERAAISEAELNRLDDSLRDACEYMRKAATNEMEKKEMSGFESLLVVASIPACTSTAYEVHEKLPLPEYITRK